MPEPDTARLDEPAAAVAVLRAAFLDRPMLRGAAAASRAAKQQLTEILDDTGTDIRVRALAASALLEPAWSYGGTVLVARKVRTRARAVLHEAVQALQADTAAPADSN